MTGYKERLRAFQRVLWLWNSHLLFLHMNQTLQNNKPAGSIIISSPCNQHSRLMRQKDENIRPWKPLVLFKAHTERNSSDRTWFTQWPQKLQHVTSPETRSQIPDAKCTFHANQRVLQSLTSPSVHFVTLQWLSVGLFFLQSSLWAAVSCSLKPVNAFHPPLTKALNNHKHITGIHTEIIYHTPFKKGRERGTQLLLLQWATSWCWKWNSDFFFTQTVKNDLL